MRKITFVLGFLLILSGCGDPIDQMVNFEDQGEDFVIAPEPDFEEKLYYPIENFEENVQLKPFGIYITPEFSPIQPEKFTGYHTGADSEIPADRQANDVSVYSIASGEILLAGFVSGYGGVVVIKHEIESSPYVAIYGHLRLASFKVSVGDKVVAGQHLAVLGKGFSSETDGEREHLHFAMMPGENIDIRGYVSNETDLGKWIDPVAFLKSNMAISH